MSLSNFVTVNITLNTRTPSRAGFGTPLVMGYHLAFPDRVRTYETLEALVDDGIDSTGVGAAIYWSVAAIFAQNPRVKTVKVGRRGTAMQQKVKLAPQSAVEGTVYTVSIAPLGGSPVEFLRTVPAASSISAEVTAIKALIDAEAFSGLATATADAGTTIELTAAAGTFFVYTGRNPELTILETTAAPAGLSADLDAVAAFDDDWYGFTLDSNSKAEALVAAAWVETKFKIYFASNGDSESGAVGTSGTLLKQLKALNYFRTSTWVNHSILPSFLGAGIMGEEFPYDPGTQTGTYHGKTVAGVMVDAPSATYEGEVLAQNGNAYVSVLGISVTEGGKMAVGEWIDVVVGRDWLTARLKEAVFGVISGSRRVPYTNGGVAMLEGAVRGVLSRAQGSIAKPGFLDPEVEYTVTSPLVEDVDPADRALRVFPDLSFSAKIAGAIHAVTLNGTISV